MLSRDVSFQDFFRKSLDFWMSTRCLRFGERFCLKFYVFPAKQKHPRDPCIIQYHSISFTPKNLQNDSHQVTSHLSCRCSRHSRKRTRNPCNNCSFVPQSPTKNVRTNSWREVTEMIKSPSGKNAFAGVLASCLKWKLVPCHTLGMAATKCVSLTPEKKGDTRHKWSISGLIQVEGGHPWLQSMTMPTKTTMYFQPLSSEQNPCYIPIY